MVRYNRVNVKLSDLQLSKLKSELLKQLKIKQNNKKVDFLVCY